MKPHAPWLKNYADVKKNLIYPKGAMWQEVFSAGEKYPDYTALTYFGRNISYSQLMRNVLRFQSLLGALGVKEGDKVAVCLPNMPQAVYALYALNRMGAVSAFLHPLSAKRELSEYIRVLNAVCIITLDSLCDTFKFILSDREDIKLIITSPEDEMLPVVRGVYRLKQGKRKKMVHSRSTLQYKELMRKSDKNPEAAQVNSSDLAVVLFSGGTTGIPKGVMLSNMNVNAMGLQTIEMSHCKVEGSKMLSAMPMFHGFGLGVCIHTALMGGASCILVPRFSVKDYAKLIKKHKPDFIAGVPTLFEALLRSSYLDCVNLSCIQGVFSGGDSLPQKLKAEFDEFLHNHGSKVRIREGYGATECVTASCLTPYNTERQGSIGIPMPDMYFKICKVGTCEEAEYGEEGEICITGPSVMMGYLNNPQETAQVLKRHSDGYAWLHSGDVGTMDSDGFVYFRCRLKRMIITSGYNVYPTLIEELICTHPRVSKCCVVGIEDSYKMQRIKAYVVPKTKDYSEAALREELFSLLRENIARYAIPKEIEFTATLPITNMGKINYRALQK